MEQFAHEGAADGQGSEVPGLEQVGPLGEGFAPTTSDGGGHVKGLAQEAVADFTEAGFAVEGCS